MSDDEVLVRVEGVSKKFCRSLKKSLWYGVCDIAGELLPGRKRQRVAGSELRVAVEEASGPATSHPLLPKLRFGKANSSPLRMCLSSFAAGSAWGSLGITGRGRRRC